MQKIAVIGTTTWGTTLSYLMAKKGLDVYLWARTAEETERLSREGSSHEKMQGISFPSNLTITADTAAALSKAEAVILAVPSQTMRTNIRTIRQHLKAPTLVISAAKGLELESNKRMSEVIAEEIDSSHADRICVLSGPNLYREILKGLPASSVIAARKDSVARKAQNLLTTSNFSVFIQHDVIGVELGGTLKNIIAIGAGMIDGLNYGDNAKAAFITRGLTEMSALSMALGANPLTLSGLSGLGDLIATCASPLSRNHFVGYELSRGKSMEEIREALGSEVSEGVTTTAAVWKLAQEMKIEMPITEKLYDILYREAKPETILYGILGTRGQHELSGKRWNLFSFFK